MNRMQIDTLSKVQKNNHEEITGILKNFRCEKCPPSLSSSSSLNSASENVSLMENYPNYN